MPRWNPSQHPRDDDGQFRSKGGGGGRSRRGGSDRVSLVGKGKSLRYSRTPTGGEVARTVAGGAARGAIVGIGAGPKGAAIGGVLGGANAAAQVFVLSRRTRKLR